MDLELPLSQGDSNYVFSSVLLGQLYYFSIRLNVAADVFMLGIYSATREPIATSIPLLPNLPLGYDLAGSNPNFPAGIFFLYDQSDSGKMPDIETLGASYKLLFRSLA